eukprot:gnl/TRDRNA2_/TRDRNA2_191510_c0_seq1.p1 gnl/TRDRNA2_/TRDRNA2_191510_c0~~gnl/TRDRNA2_/TRDRNA2_191510_c0_seq1.p1  ORF type:complete len:350 (-),score=78.02 gnl/TRDRNA2_/TRDRNA2_191510_c0_seq1:190-1239(-)
MQAATAAAARSVVVRQRPLAVAAVAFRRAARWPSPIATSTQVQWSPPGLRRFSTTAGGAGGEPAGKDDTSSGGEAKFERMVKEDTTTEAPASDDGAQAAEAGSSNPYPQVLWKARTVDKEFKEAEDAIQISVAVTAGGMGAALLGIAPFTAPNPFMIGLLLAAVQVRLALTWQTRQLRAQARRHITSVTQTEGTRVVIECDGGVERSLRLATASVDASKPSLGDLFKDGGNFLYLDNELREGGEETGLEELLHSDLIIAAEELTVKAMEEEPQQEAEKIVQRLATLNRQELESIAKRSGDNISPKASMAQVVRSSQMIAAAVLTGGCIMCVAGRAAASAPPVGAVPLAD